MDNISPIGGSIVESGGQRIDASSDSDTIHFRGTQTADWRITANGFGFGNSWFVHHLNKQGFTHVARYAVASARSGFRGAGEEEQFGADALNFTSDRSASGDGQSGAVNLNQNLAGDWQTAKIDNAAFWNGNVRNDFRQERRRGVTVDRKTGEDFTSYALGRAYIRTTIYFRPNQCLAVFAQVKARLDIAELGVEYASVFINDHVKSPIFRRSGLL
ncbi:hypothetical protein D3C80_961900 [compost metagenome]